MSKGYSSLFQACEPATGNTLEPTDDDTRGTSKQPLSTTADELSQVTLQVTTGIAEVEFLCPNAHHNAQPTEPKQAIPAPMGFINCRIMWS